MIACPDASPPGSSGLVYRVACVRKVYKPKGLLSVFATQFATRGCSLVSVPTKRLSVAALWPSCCA